MAVILANVTPIEPEAAPVCRLASSPVDTYVTTTRISLKSTFGLTGSPPSAAPANSAWASIARWSVVSCVELGRRINEFGS